MGLHSFLSCFVKLNSLLDYKLNFLSYGLCPFCSLSLVQSHSIHVVFRVFGLLKLYKMGCMVCNVFIGELKDWLHPFHDSFSLYSQYFNISDLAA